MDHTKTGTESDKGQTSKSPGRRGRGDRGKSRNNTRNSAASTNKDYKGGIEEFGDVIMLKYEKVQLNKYFDVFREVLISYTDK